MQCPNCYDEEIHGSNFNRVVKKTHLEMEEVCHENGYAFFQCPRCAMTRKQQRKFLSSGLIEGTTSDELKKITEKSSGGAVATVVGIGLAVLLIGAIIGSDNDN